MKIGFVLDDSLDKTDGVQQYVLTLGHWYAAQGHDVHYLVGHTERHDVPNIHSLSRNLRVQFNQNRMSTPLPVRSNRIRQLLHEQQFDVLHVQLPYSPFLAGRVIKAAPTTTAVIGTFHILPFSKIESAATRALAAAVKKSRRKFDAVVSVSEPAMHFARKRFKVDSQVVPNAVPVARFRANQQQARKRSDSLTLVCLGRLVERKGCQQLLEAIRLLQARDQLADTRVIIAGKGPLLPRLQAFVRRNHLEDYVEFAGYVSEADKPKLLASADIAVLPSMGGESFGIVLVEAMAAGADVVIAGDNPGYRTVMDGHDEQIVNPKDALAFAETLRHFMVDAAARRRAKKWQRSRAAEFDVEVVGKKLLDIYTQALRNKRGMR